jgi:nucleotidyltransferase AbiEii toxin of type IV toxin-antitoxin system
MSSGLSVGFMLDRQWHWLRGEMETTKKPTLLALGRIFAETQTPYAIIGGIALQVHSSDPRTTIDIDLAVLSREAIPREAMTAAGFRMTGSFEHSENWQASDGTPIQFTDDPALERAVVSAEEVVVDDVVLRVISAADLLHEKLRSGRDAARRRTKRHQDLVDAETLLDAHPELERHLSADERALIERLPD